MTDQVSNSFALTHLPSAAARLGWLAARPRAVAVACIVVLTALGWSVLGGALTQSGGSLWTALCGPLDASMSLIVVLWLAMVLAMMLPTAAPMILTYAEIAEAAARKGERIVSPLMLAAGYCAVWIAAALAAAAGQILFADAVPRHWTPALTAAAFVGAGLYQFTALKHACLSRCRQPFLFFFLNWTTTPQGVFRLGARQGLDCLGCCWAMMALMFVGGAMNVVWMAALAIYMTAEKLGSGRWLTQIGGLALIATGIGLFIINMITG